VTVTEALQKGYKSLGGELAKQEDILLFKKELSHNINDLCFWIEHYPLVGMLFSLPEEQDDSGMGVELKWLSPKEILDESRHSYPGIPALSKGYIPIGACLEGSGDPYFIKAGEENPPLVRIMHESVSQNGNLNIDDIEIVRSEISDFFILTLLQNSE
jgi:hypothetical protein